MITVFITLRPNQKWKWMASVKKKKWWLNRRIPWAWELWLSWLVIWCWYSENYRQSTTALSKVSISSALGKKNKTFLQCFTIGWQLSPLLCGGLSYWHLWMTNWLRFLIYRQRNKISLRIMKTAPLHYQTDNLSNKTDHLGIWMTFLKVFLAYLSQLWGNF